MSRRPLVNATPALLARIAAQEAKPMPTRIDLPPAKPSKADDQAEKDFQSDVIAYLRSAKGIRQIDVDHTRRGLPAGVPDLRFAYMGRPIFMELKTSKGQTTGEQDKDHERRLMDGWIGGVFRTIPDIKAFLDKLENQGDGQ